MKWRQDHQVNSFSEKVLLAYFVCLKKKFKPSSLWTTYSMLRSTISINHEVDISKYSRLRALLKKESTGFVPQKSKTLSSDEAKRFLKDAPDDQFLMMKVVLGMGVLGACRPEELRRLTIDDVEDHGQSILVKIRNGKNKTPRVFSVIGDVYYICKKYMSLRPSGSRLNQFFLKYANGRCYGQPVGKNTIGRIPKLVAGFLKLKDPNAYTGHTFRRTSATLHVNTGRDIDVVKRVGWKLSTTTEGYMDESRAEIATSSTSICESTNANDIIYLKMDDPTLKFEILDT